MKVRVGHGVTDECEVFSLREETPRLPACLERGGKISDAFSLANEDTC